jgi:hypothetical protein
MDISSSLPEVAVVLEQFAGDSEFYKEVAMTYHIERVMATSLLGGL